MGVRQRRGDLAGHRARGFGQRWGSRRRRDAPGRHTGSVPQREQRAARRRALARRRCEHGRNRRARHRAWRIDSRAVARDDRWRLLPLGQRRAARVRDGKGQRGEHRGALAKWKDVRHFERASRATVRDRRDGGGCAGASSNRLARKRSLCGCDIAARPTDARRFGVRRLSTAAALTESSEPIGTRCELDRRGRRRARRSRHRHRRWWAPRRAAQRGRASLHSAHGVGRSGEVGSHHRTPRAERTQGNLPDRWSVELRSDVRRGGALDPFGRGFHLRERPSLVGHVGAASGLRERWSAGARRREWRQPARSLRGRARQAGRLAAARAIPSLPARCGRALAARHHECPGVGHARPRFVGAVR